MSMENINQEEINRFSSFADNWWDKEGVSKPLHDLNPVRLAYILCHADVKDKNVLDVGCGAGILTESLSKAGASAIGIDASSELINCARSHALESSLSIQYEVSTAENYSNKYPNYFDVITCLELLEHVPSPELLLKACKTLLKPGGMLFVSTLNRTLKGYVYAILAAEYLLNLLPKHTHEYKKFIQPAELHAWCRNAGLTCLDFQGIDYQPFSSKASLSTSLSINYIACIKNMD